MAEGHEGERVVSDTFSFEVLPEVVPLENAGRQVFCLRCGRECRVARQANMTARPVRNADGDGLCPDCVITDVLRTEIEIEHILPGGVDPREALRSEHIREMVGRVLGVGRSDLELRMIDWDRVIANWDLPLPKKPARRARKRR